MHRILILLAIASSVVETPAIGQQKLSLKAKLMPLIERHEGDVAVSVKHLKTGERFDHRADDVMPTASLCKLGVMVAAYRRVDSGAVDLNKAIVLKADDMVPGSGILTQHFSPGTTLSLRDAIRLMIAYSDNTATNLVTDAIGLKTTSEEMTSLGFAETKIHSKVYRRDTSIFPDRSKKYSLGSTTAGETVALLEQLHKKKCASESACDAMIQHLLECDDDSKIASGLPSTIRFAHKTGAVNAIRCDGGLILAEDGPIAICILTRNNKDKRWSPQNAAHRLCRDVGQIVYEHFEPEQPSRSIVLGEPLRTGAFGEIVEMLQRTLSARLRPSPELSIDGDFGPATETAVRRFQESKELPVTGIVNRDTWTALGTLVAPAPQPEPDVVNNAILHKDSPDEIDGPPLTTCRGYAVLDAESGKVVLGVKPDTKFEPASTTKIMTGWLVAKLAEENTDILDEVVVFSQRADLMRGSTSGLRAGERISVREALYGLMLPSGNDMSVALAEHFGSRLAPSTDGSLSAYQEFVNAMNREAEQLGMKNTHYENPHGWPHDRHLTTARDQCILAQAVFENDTFRQVVQSRQRGVKVEGASGYTRNVVWKNSNKLLAIEGFDGIKTGTTTRAGACLVSTAERNGRRLFVVVLGSTSGDARYVDTRNLFRYAWQMKSGK